MLFRKLGFTDVALLCDDSSDGGETVMFGAS